MGTRVLHTKKQKRGKKKRGAHFWEVDVQSDLDFRNLVKTMKKNIVFLKNVNSLKKRRKKRGADFGELDFCIPKQNNAEKNAEHKSGCSALFFIVNTVSLLTILLLTSYFLHVNWY